MKSHCQVSVVGLKSLDVSPYNELLLLPMIIKKFFGTRTHESTFGVHYRTGSPGQLGLQVAGFPGHWVAGSQNVTQFHVWSVCLSVCLCFCRSVCLPLRPSLCVLCCMRVGSCASVSLNGLIANFLRRSYFVTPFVTQRSLYCRSQHRDSIHSLSVCLFSVCSCLECHSRNCVLTAATRLLMHSLVRLFVCP